MNKLTIEDVLKIAEPLIDTDVERSFVITESELVQLANAIHQQAYDAGVRAEREEAAKVCDSEARTQRDYINSANPRTSEHLTHLREGHEKGAERCAAAIRARKEVGNE